MQKKETKSTRKIDKIVSESMSRASEEGHPISRETAYENALVVHRRANKDIVATSGKNAAEGLMALFRTFGTYNANKKGGELNGWRDKSTSRQN